VGVPEIEVTNVDTVVTTEVTVLRLIETLTPTLVVVEMLVIVVV
jgi:hypothetical protein